MPPFQFNVKFDYVLSGFSETIPFWWFIFVHFSLPVVNAFVFLGYKVEILLVIFWENGPLKRLRKTAQLINTSRKLYVLLNVVKFVQSRTLAHILLMPIKPKLLHRLFPESFV